MPRPQRTVQEPDVAGAARRQGETTRAAILIEALRLASEVGFEGLTIGVLASKVGMSKSGLYAHFDSKEALQCAALDYAADSFKAVVVSPAFSQPRGLARLDTLLTRWIHWERDELPGGCPFIVAAAEFDDRPGPTRDLLVSYINQMVDAIARSATYAIEVGDFREDLDTRQYAYEFWGTVLAYQQFERLLGADDAEAMARAAIAQLNARASA